jgi:hypothetical protein
MNGNLSPLKAYNKFDMEFLDDSSIKRISKVQLFARNVNHELTNFIFSIPYATNNINMLVIFDGKELIKDIDYVIYEELENNIFVNKLVIINIDIINDGDVSKPITIISSRKNISSNLIYNASNFTIISQEDRDNEFKDDEYNLVEVDNTTKYIIDNIPVNNMDNLSNPKIWELLISTDCPFESTSNVIKQLSSSELKNTIENYSKFKNIYGTDHVDFEDQFPNNITIDDAGSININTTFGNIGLFNGKYKFTVNLGSDVQAIYWTGDVWVIEGVNNSDEFNTLYVNNTTTEKLYPPPTGWEVYLPEYLGDSPAPTLTFDIDTNLTKKTIYGVDIAYIINMMLSDNSFKLEVENSIDDDILFDNLLTKYGIGLIDKKYLDTRLFNVYCNPNIDDPVDLISIMPTVIELANRLYPNFEYLFE